jgi:hypothetical protein
MNNQQEDLTPEFLADLHAAWPCPPVPEGLAISAIARTAKIVVEELEPRATPKTLIRSREPFLTRQMVNLAVVAALLFLGLGLGLHLVQQQRRQAELMACQNNLREIHAGLAGYSDLHAGQFPKAGSAAVPAAGDFLQELQRNGQLVSDRSKWCPTTGRLELPVGYAYTLGYRDNGALTGLSKPKTADDYSLLVSDLPSVGLSMTSHPHGGWNVLSVGGSVRLTTVSTIGPDGDDIFSNAAGERRAGLHRYDTCLGLPADRP